VVQVVGVPVLPHGLVVQAVRSELDAYSRARPGAIFFISPGSDAAMRLPRMQSERHPDLAVYLNPPPSNDPQPWEFWTPDIVVEVISPGCEERDYVIKREEYVRAGVRLYWIIDPSARTATALTRRGDTWAESRLDASGVITTPLLPGFALPLADVFAASDRSRLE
jgi:Uma2 family endonuclease